MQPSKRHRDVGGMVMAALFILLGAVLYYDTTTMIDPDSYVFPRAIIAAMVALSLAVIIVNLVRPGAETGTQERGSVVRRVGLIAAMLGATALMPVFGFVLSGLIAFMIIMAFAMYDPWTRFRLIVYPVVGAAIVVGFYILFKQMLFVPLPTGSLF
ncbi:MAG: tripartite tricarboxylate transporter TctB family protein [Kiloniellaceae bacterium]